MDGEFVEVTKCADDDFCAIQDGYVSITPIHYDMTDYARLDFFKNWDIQKEI